MTDAEEDPLISPLRKAAADVLNDPVFQRSPRLATLLRYLLEVTIEGKAGSLKSITIAIEGLDRSPSDSPDAYARVQVARLRSALQQYCASQPAGVDCLQIKAGSYELFVAPNPAAESAPGVLEAENLPARDVMRSRHRRMLQVAVAVALLAGIFFIGYRWHYQLEAPRWETLDFPLLTVEVNPPAQDGPDSDSVAELERQLVNKLNRYEALRLVQGKSANPDFSLHVTVDRTQNGVEQNVTLLDARTGSVVWASEFHTPDQSEAALAGLAADISFQVGNTTGAIHSYNRRMLFATDSPYACWLRFSGAVETSSTIGDDELYDCAEKWYRHASQHPIAAMLRGWTLTDRSLTQLSEAGRAGVIDDALSVLYNAKALEPRSTGLHIATMRAQAFAGNFAEMKMAGSTALRLNPDSAHVKALVGMSLALWNDRDGVRLIEQALEQRSPAPPWYHVGLCIDAFMRDDLPREEHELGELQPIRAHTPLLAILFAAHAAREGKIAEARGFLDRRPFRTTFGGIEVERVMARLPVAPAVRLKLRRTLEPALRDD